MWHGYAVTSSTLLADPPSNETIDVSYIKRIYRAAVSHRLRNTPLGFQEVEGPRCLDSRHMKVVSVQPYAPAAFTPRLSRPQQCLNPLGLVLRCIKAIQ